MIFLPTPYHPFTYDGGQTPKAPKTEERKPHQMKSDLETITTMILLLRPYPDIFRHACMMLGSFFPVVGLDGLPSDQGDNRTNHRTFPRHTAAWLHRQIDFEVDIGTHTTKGFYSYLTEQGKLWRILE